MKPYNIIEKAFLLKNTPIFKGLELDSLLSIAEKLDLITYPKDTMICERGEESFHLFLIIQGKILLDDGKHTQLLHPGEFFGDENVFSGTSRSYQAITKEKSTLLSLFQRHLYTIMSECPSVAIAWLETYAKHTPMRPRP